MRSSNPMMIQFVRSAEPPWARKGIARPVSGMTRVTPPTTTKHCNAMVKERPVASSFPKPSRKWTAVRRPRMTMTM